MAEKLKSIEYLSDQIRKVNVSNAKIEIMENQVSHQKFIAMARLSFKERVSVYKLNDEIIQELQRTRIENMPMELPQIFLKPFIIETISEKDVLFGDIISIVGFFSPVKNNDLIKQFNEDPNKFSKNMREELSNIVKRDGENMIFTIIFQTKSYNENRNWQEGALNLNKVATSKKEDKFGFCGYNIFWIIPNIKKTDWVFNKINYDREIIMNKNYCRICQNNEICDKNGRFTVDHNYNFCIDGLYDNLLSIVTNFNYLLFANNTAIEFKEVHESINSVVLNKRNKIVKRTDEWIVKYLYINKEKIKYKNAENQTPMNKDGFVLTEIKVKEHERNQPYGPGRTLIRRIRIESFKSTKWIRDGDIKIIVKAKE